MVAPAVAAPALGMITTAVGTIGDGGPATAAFVDATSLATDTAGNVYATELNRIRRIDVATHIVSTIAGNGLSSSAGDGGPAVDASLSGGSVAVAGNGDIYVADALNSVIRKIVKSTGVITAFAGTGVSGSTGDGGQALAAELTTPYGIALDSVGNLYIADVSVSKIRKVATNGVITTVAGTGVAGYSGNNQLATTAQLRNPSSIVFDGSDNMFISDSGNNRIRKVAAGTGIITSIAGTGVGGFNGDGLANAAQLDTPVQIAYANNFVYVADQSNNRIRRINLSTVSISTVAGNGVGTSTGDGGPAANATVHYPMSIAILGSTLYVADQSSTIRAITGVGTPSPMIASFAGIGRPFAGDGGPATAAVLGQYQKMVIGVNGDLYIDDSYNARVRRVDKATGIITTLAGTGATQYNGDGPVATTNLQLSSIAPDAAGNVYVAEGDYAYIRKVVVATGMVTTVAGTGNHVLNGDGPALTTNVTPNGLAIDETGDVYIADAEHALVRKLTVSSGMITTIAGTGALAFNGDGPVATTNIEPDFITVDHAGDLYIADSTNNRIRKITIATGMVTTLVGTGGTAYNGDQAGTATNLDPSGIAVDGFGNIYAADFDNHRVRRWDAATKQMSTVAGTGVPGSDGDGGLATSARLVSPATVALDATGQLFIADVAMRRIRVMTVPIPAVTPPPPAAQPPYVAVSPERLLDTRIGVGAPAGKLTAGATLVLQVTGAGATAIPPNASAVALNVTVTEPDAPGFLTVWPCGSPQPLASNVNYSAGQTIPNLVVVKLGAGGTVCFAGQATTHIVADVDGWFSASPTYTPVTPERLLDTRSGVGAPVGKLAAGHALTLQVTGAGTTNVPATASAVAINVTVTEPDVDGFLTVWPCGLPQPLASNLNYRAGQTIPNLVIAKLGTGGTLCIAGQATTHIVADINGWFAPTAAFDPLTPERILDTRAGVGAPAAPLAAGQTLTLQVTGAGASAIPTTAKAVVVNVTVTDPTSDGFLTVWPCGSPQPLASNLNYSAGQTIPNLVISQLGTGGTICIAAQATTNIVADIDGWFA